MQQADTARALARLGAAYRVQIDPGQAQVWHDTIGGFHPEHATYATDEWIRTQPRFPSPSEFLVMMQGAARRALQTDQVALPPSPKAGREASLTALRLLREYLSKVPAHDHHRSVVCPACSTSEVRRIAHEERSRVEYERLRAAGAFVADR